MSDWMTELVAITGPISGDDLLTVKSEKWNGASPEEAAATIRPTLHSDPAHDEYVGDVG